MEDFYHYTKKSGFAIYERREGALSSISLPIERAPPLSNSLYTIYFPCICILYLFFCNIIISVSSFVT